MKAITIAQWNRMNPRQRSWLVVKALGKRSAKVYWSLHHPDGGTCGGSYESRKYAFAIVDRAQEMVGEYLAARAKGPRAISKWMSKYPDHSIETVTRFSICVVRCSVAYPTYAEYDHLAAELMLDLMMSGEMVSLKHYRDAQQFMVGDSVRSSVGNSLAAATALTFLKSKGLVLE
jgi:hypothetical protein